MKIIFGITINKLTDEFVIHGTDAEYDYYYISHKRSQILQTIYSAYCELFPNEKFKFASLTEKSLKNYVTSKKEKKSNPTTTRMDKDHYSSIEDFLLQKNKTVGEINRNGVVGPNIPTSTVYSSHKKVKDVKLDDFKVLKVIGRGSFGKVCLVEYLPTHETYAMKSLKKDVLIEQEQIENTLLEKEILQTIDYPLLCGLVFCF